MRRIVLWLAGTAVVVMLLIGYHTSTSGPVASSPTHGRQPPGIVSPSAAPRGSAGATAPPATGDTLVNGAVVDTRWGPVQVQIKVAGGRITEVTPLVYPDGNDRDQQINAYALPILRQEALAAQSARIDGVSGATVTSDGYRASLQSALDAAGLGGA